MNRVKQLVHAENVYRMGYTGKNIRVVTLDTGVYLHPDLRQNVVAVSYTHLCKNHFGKADNVKVVIDPDTCEYHCYQEKTVVETVDCLLYTSWDFIVSNNAMPLGSLILALFCCTRRGWGWNLSLIHICCLFRQNRRNKFTENS